MQWFRIFPNRILTGSTWEELTAEERGVFFTILVHAAYSNIHGVICVAKDIPYTPEQIEGMTKIPTAIFDRCCKKLIDVEKIAIENGIIYVANWDRYQTEYERQKPFITKRKREEEKDNAELEKKKPSYNDYKIQWNEFASKHGLSTIKDLSPERIRKLKVRELEKEFDFNAILEMAAKQKFLLGDSKEGWKVSFDFVICSRDNYNKILEGNYGVVQSAPKKESNEVIVRDEFGNPIKRIIKKQLPTNDKAGF